MLLTSPSSAFAAPQAIAASHRADTDGLNHMMRKVPSQNRRKKPGGKGKERNCRRARVETERRAAGLRVGGEVAARSVQRRKDVVRHTNGGGGFCSCVLPSR